MVEKTPQPFSRPTWPGERDRSAASRMSLLCRRKRCMARSILPVRACILDVLFSIIESETLAKEQYMAGDNTLNFSDSSWDQDVLKSDVPVLVDFWAPWCGPCKAMAPTVDALATEYRGKLKVGKLNTDD